MSKDNVNRELLQTVRDVNAELEKLPIHSHQKAVEALIVLGNHRLACAQVEQQELQRQAEIDRAMGVDLPRLVTQ